MTTLMLKSNAYASVARSNLDSRRAGRVLSAFLA